MKCKKQLKWHAPRASSRFISSACTACPRNRGPLLPLRILLHWDRHTAVGPASLISHERQLALRHTACKDVNMCGSKSSWFLNHHRTPVAGRRPDTCIPLQKQSPLGHKSPVDLQHSVVRRDCEVGDALEHMALLQR